MAKQKGSDVQQPDVSKAAVVPKKVPESFYRFSYLDGEEKEFKTKEDLDAGFRKSYLRSRELERERKKLDDDRTEFTTKFEDLQKEREHERAVSRQYLEWDQRLQSDPQMYAQVKSILDGGRTMGVQPQSNGTSPMEERLAKLEEQLEQSRNESQVETAWRNVTTKYPDLDRESAEELLARVQNGNEEELLDVLYHATRGYSSNGTSDAAVTQQVETEMGQADLTPSGGAPVPNDPSYSSPQDAADAAYAALVPGGSE